MKYTIGLLLCWIGLSPASAQKTVEKHIDFSQKNLVALNIQIADSIQVHTWNKNEVYVKASIDVNDNKDNDLYNMVFGDSGNAVAVVAKLDFEKARRRSDSCDCCNGVHIYGNYNCTRAHVSCEVYLPENADLSIETINANIIITGRTAAVRAHTISGFVDLTVAPERKADLKLNTVTGTVYTNIAMNVPPRNNHTPATHITDLINGGGKPINLESISGNIFLRKSE
ncbi:MAG TPA: hypothetical protein VNS58_11460 [Puia sp.]|nr:hypothetical protein [Puia sp.]